MAVERNLEILLEILRCFCEIVSLTTKMIVKGLGVVKSGKSMYL